MGGLVPEVAGLPISFRYVTTLHFPGLFSAVVVTSTKKTNNK